MIHEYFCRTCGRIHAESFRGKPSRIFLEHMAFAGKDDLVIPNEAENIQNTNKQMEDYPESPEPKPLKSFKEVNLDKIGQHIKYVACAEGTFVVLRDSMMHPIKLVDQKKCDTEWEPNFKLGRMTRYNIDGKRVEREFDVLEVLEFKERCMKEQGKRFGPISRRLNRNKLMKMRKRMGIQ